MINDAIIEALVKIGNHPEVMKMTEPNIFCPQALQNWMVARTLKAIELLQEAYDIQQNNTQSDNKQSKPRRSKGICKVPAK